VLHGGPDHLTDKGMGLTFKFWDSSRIPGMAEARDLIFCLHIVGSRP